MRIIEFRALPDGVRQAHLILGRRVRQSRIVLEGVGFPCSATLSERLLSAFLRRVRVTGPSRDLTSRLEGLGDRQATFNMTAACLGPWLQEVGIQQ
jgi:hypothetical protein